MSVQEREGERKREAEVMVDATTDQKVAEQPVVDAYLHVERTAAWADEVPAVRCARQREETRKSTAT